MREGEEREKEREKRRGKGRGEDLESGNLEVPLHGKDFNRSGFLKRREYTVL